MNDIKSYSRKLSASRGIFSDSAARWRKKSHERIFIYKGCLCTRLATWRLGMLRTALAEAFLFPCGRGKIFMRTEASADAHPVLARCARSICRMRTEILLRAHAFVLTSEYYKFMLRMTVQSRIEYLKLRSQIQVFNATFCKTFQSASQN
ncbi:MAG: hypothetical protein LBJ63_02375 [Prevotellaceae bacterium]|nr:hypothetical protein [Prevotellaceae bacterium]